MNGYHVVIETDKETLLDMLFCYPPIKADVVRKAREEMRDCSYGKHKAKIIAKKLKGKQLRYNDHGFCHMGLGRYGGSGCDLFIRRREIY
jgi:hypothetical protein